MYNHMYLYIYVYAHAYLYMYIYTVYTSIYVLSVYYVHFQHTPYFLDFPENCVTDISWFKENLFCLLSNANTVISIVKSCYRLGELICSNFLFFYFFWSHFYILFDFVLLPSWLVCTERKIL
jgi:hypothetical protein